MQWPFSAFCWSFSCCTLLVSTNFRPYRIKQLRQFLEREAYPARVLLCLVYVCGTNNDEQIFFLPNVTQGLLCVQEAGAYACETCLEFDLTKCSPERPCCIHADNTSAFCFFGPTPESTSCKQSFSFLLLHGSPNDGRTSLTESLP